MLKVNDLRQRGAIEPMLWHGQSLPAGVSTTRFRCFAVLHVGTKRPIPIGFRFGRYFLTKVFPEGPIPVSWMITSPSLAHV